MELLGTNVSIVIGSWRLRLAAALEEIDDSVDVSTRSRRIVVTPLADAAEVERRRSGDAIAAR